ncbi:MAG: dolichyl-phosphate beta-glucosyltransferase [Anaerolineales bacterium]
MPLLSLIIPAYNEEQRLPRTLTKIQAFLKDQPYESEILVVENGSNDRTAAIAEEFAPGVHLLREPDRGKGLAVRRGMMEASGDFRFICDADLSMPIEEVDLFLPPKLDDFDIAIASREVAGAIRHNEPAYRHWIGRAFNLLVRTMAVPGFQDTQCGFKCFTAEAADTLFPLQQINGWAFDVELLFVALRLGYRVKEVPINWYYFPGSRVRIIRDSWLMLSDLFRIRSNWRRGFYQPLLDPSPD